ncbi:hypothetical protein [Aliarcobacter cryaerophilus]|uniref:hypothetical protein n=1 Tax=Aliarcobacter cryaerophilus TaxID=28198 RepID=UPI00112F17F6|nr:hypothetical protein [Aliarcobacter cryaerophilus]
MKILENIKKNINDFKADTLKLDKFLTGTYTSYSFFQHKYPEVKKEFNEKKSRSKDEIEAKMIFENLNESISIYKLEIYKYCFINLIARLDAFLNDIAKSMYLWKKSDLEEDKRKKIILEFSHASFKSKLKHLKKEFGLIFPSIEEWELSIIELFSTRNIILHNDGLVNETYLNINKDSKLNIDDKRVVDEEYLKLTLVLAIIIAKSIEEQVIKAKDN